MAMDEYGMQRNIWQLLSPEQAFQAYKQPKKPILRFWLTNTKIKWSTPEPMKRLMNYKVDQD